MAYFLLVIAGLLFSVRIVFSKLYSKKNGETLGSSLLFATFFSIFSAIFMFAINGFKFEFSWYSFIFASITAVLETLMSIIAVRILGEGNSVVYTVFLLLGGVVGPIIYGTAFLGEKPSISCIIGLVVSMSALFVPLFAKHEKKKATLLFFILCIVTFIINSFGNIAIKMHQISNEQIVSSQMYTATYFAIMAILNPIIYGFWRIKHKQIGPENKLLINKWLYIFAICYGVVGGGASLLNIYCASTVPATIQPALVSCFSIIGSSILGIVIFKDKIKPQVVIQVILSLVGGILLMF